MVIDYELKAGLVFGIEHDVVYLVDKPDDDPDFDKPPTSMILLHLGIVTISMIMV